MSRFGQPTGRRAATFYAAYDGDCITCGEEIFEGDLIGYLPDDIGVSCGGCVEEYNDEQ